MLTTFVLVPSEGEQHMNVLRVGLIITTALLAGYPTWAAEGIAVTVSHRNQDVARTTPEDQKPVPEQDWGLIKRNVGRLVRYNFKDKRVQSHDTLITDWLVSAPSIKLEGTHVAFFKYPVKRGPGRQIERFGTMCTVATVPIDGGEIADLAETHCDPDGGYLDWASDGYIYWIDVGNPNHGDQVKVWRVSESGGQKELVMDYLDVTPPDGKKMVWDNTPYILRWNISQDAKWGIAHRQPYGVRVPEKSNDGLDWWAGTYPHCFPPPGNSARACDPIYTYVKRDAFGDETAQGIRGCNPAISPTGNYVAHYDGASHAHFYIQRWDHSKNELQHMDLGHGPRGGIQVHQDIVVWADTSNPKIDGGQWNAFACNSDKWQMQQCQIAEAGKGGKGFPDRGSQQVACNWVDREGIILSNNPSEQPIQVYDDITNGSVYYASTSGDLWVRPPSDIAGKRYVEDVAGNWIPVDGSQPLSERAANYYFTLDRQVCEVTGYDDQGNPLTSNCRELPSIVAAEPPFRTNRPSDGITKQGSVVNLGQGTHRIYLYSALGQQVHHETTSTSEWFVPNNLRSEGIVFMRIVSNRNGAAQEQIFRLNTLSR